MMSDTEIRPGEFGDYMARVRIDKGLSRQKLAEMVDVDTTTIWRYESNLVQPAIDKAIKIIEALGGEVIWRQQ